MNTVITAFWNHLLDGRRTVFSICTQIRKRPPLRHYHPGTRSKGNAARDLTNSVPVRRACWTLTTHHLDNSWSPDYRTRCFYLKSSWQQHIYFIILVPQLTSPISLSSSQSCVHISKVPRPSTPQNDCIQLSLHVNSSLSRNCTIIRRLIRPVLSTLPSFYRQGHVLQLPRLSSFPRSNRLPPQA